MGAYYFDSSALVKRYTQEVGSPWVTSRTDVQAGNEVFIALITGVEIAAIPAKIASSEACSD